MPPIELVDADAFDVLNGHRERRNPEFECEGDSGQLDVRTVGHDKGAFTFTQGRQEVSPESQLAMRESRCRRSARNEGCDLDTGAKGEVLLDGDHIIWRDIEKRLGAV